MVYMGTVLFFFICSLCAHKNKTVVLTKPEIVGLCPPPSASPVTADHSKLIIILKIIYTNNFYTRKNGSCANKNEQINIIIYYT